MGFELPLSRPEQQAYHERSRGLACCNMPFYLLLHEFRGRWPSSPRAGLSRQRETLCPVVSDGDPSRGNGEKVCREKREKNSLRSAKMEPHNLIGEGKNFFQETGRLLDCGLSGSGDPDCATCNAAHFQPAMRPESLGAWKGRRQTSRRPAVVNISRISASE